MFGLRTQHTDTGAESNSFLGKVYVLYHRGDADWKKRNDFQKALKELDLEHADKVIAVIIDETGKATPLFAENNHYIVGANGRTYQKL